MSRQPVPILINARNRVTWTRQTFEQLSRWEGAWPIVVDNDSTWGPMREWLYTLPQQKVYHVEGNAGCYGIWNEIRPGGIQRLKYIFESCLDSVVEHYGYYAVTDDDLDYEGVPADALGVMIAILKANPGLDKVGLSLRIDDLPDRYPLKQEVIRDQAKHWTEADLAYYPDRTEAVLLYHANVDTTMAVYRTAEAHTLGSHHQVKGVRLAPPYCARHRPWYQAIEDMSEEDWYATAQNTGYGVWTDMLRTYCRARGIDPHGFMSSPCGA